MDQNVIDFLKMLILGYPCDTEGYEFLGAEEFCGSPQCRRCEAKMLLPLEELGEVIVQRCECCGELLSSRDSDPETAERGFCSVNCWVTEKGFESYYGYKEGEKPENW